MKEILNFNSMLTPKIITFVYWLLLFGVIIGGLSSMFAGYGFSFTGFLMGLVYIFAGSIAARIWCELLIVLFKINESLQILRDK